MVANIRKKFKTSNYFSKISHILHILKLVLHILKLGLYFQQIDMPSPLGRS